MDVARISLLSRGKYSGVGTCKMMMLLGVFVFGVLVGAMGILLWLTRGETQKIDKGPPDPLDI